MMLESSPFWYTHKQNVIFVVYFVIVFVNTVPAMEGISRVLSPHEIITHQKIDFKKDCISQFGLHVEANTDAAITNDTMSRTYRCIVLGPSGNWYIRNSSICAAR